MLSLFHKAAHALPLLLSSPPGSSTHLYCWITVQIVFAPTHPDSYCQCLWIDRIWGEMLPALFSARSGQNLLQNMPIWFSNYILKVLLRNRDIASDLQMTNHFSIFILHTICFYRNKLKRRCWPEESFYLGITEEKLVAQQVEDMFGNIFLPVRHCESMFSSSLGSIINIIFLFLQFAFPSIHKTWQEGRQSFDKHSLSYALWSAEWIQAIFTLWLGA